MDAASLTETLGVTRWIQAGNFVHVSHPPSVNESLPQGLALCVAPPPSRTGVNGGSLSLSLGLDALCVCVCVCVCVCTGAAFLSTNTPPRYSVGGCVGL